MAEVLTYIVNLSVGLFDHPTPSVISSVYITDIDKRKTPEEAISRVVTQMNKDLTAYFRTAPIPVTWDEKFEAMLKALVFFFSGDIPQIR